MSKQKTQPGTGDVAAFIAQVDDAGKRQDCDTLMALMAELSGEPATLWGTMVGFGQYHYRYASGHQGDAFLIGFAPRKAEFSIYLMGEYGADTCAERAALFARLGKHRMGKACLYVKRLSDIDLNVLRELGARSIAALRARYPAQ